MTRGYEDTIIYSNQHYGNLTFSYGNSAADPRAADPRAPPPRQFSIPADAIYLV